jgi:hypothetical protein
MDPALILTKRENESLLDRLRNIWLEQNRDTQSSDEPTESTDLMLLERWMRA